MNDEFDDIFEDCRERAELEGVARMLESERPLPSPVFRGELARSLRAGTTQPTPRRLRARVIALVAAGVLLLTSAGIGIAGQGPLAPSAGAAAPAATASR
jgi:hypothetical protein